jgi:hypothetical protein
MKTTPCPQVGAPDPELKNSPIFDMGDEDILSLDLELESGGCDFNAVRYPLGQYVQSVNELLHCEERGVWVRTEAAD